MYLWNQLPNLSGIFTKLKPLCPKTQNQVLGSPPPEFRLILLAHITYADSFNSCDISFFECRILQTWKRWWLWHEMFDAHFFCQISDIANSRGNHIIRPITKGPFILRRYCVALPYCTLLPGGGGGGGAALVFQAGYHPRKRTFKTHPKHVFFRYENRS